VRSCPGLDASDEELTAAFAASAGLEGSPSKKALKNAKLAFERFVVALRVVAGAK
jgi:hypothetical protein